MKFIKLLVTAFSLMSMPYNCEAKKKQNSKLDLIEQ